MLRIGILTLILLFLTSINYPVLFEANEVLKLCKGDDKPYRSDTDPLYQDIENFQAKSLRAGGYPLLQNRPNGQEEIDGLCDTIGKEMGWPEEDCKKVKSLSSKVARTTRCESSGPYFIAENLIDSVVNTAKRVLNNSPSTVPVGTVQLQSINAGMFSFDSGKAILFNTHLFSFVNEMTKMMSTGIQFTEEGDKIVLNYSPENAEKIFQSAPFFRERFAREVYYFLTGREKPDWWMPERNKVLLYSRLTEWVEIFIAAHEYGHYYADHQGKTNIFSQLSSSDVCRNWENEFEADEIGLILTYHNASQDPFFELYKNTPELWFVAVAILDEGRQILQGEESANQDEKITKRLIEGCFEKSKPIEDFPIPISYSHRTHPPTDLRMIRAWYVKAQLLGTESLEKDASWGTVLLTLWSQARPVFKELVEANR